MALWLEELKGDPDEEFLSDGITNGFQLLPVDTKLLPAEMNSYRSVTAAAVRDKVEYTLLQEIAIGNYVVSDVRPTIISAIGAVPRADSDKICLIHDCSQPKGSVNDYADIDSFKYQNNEDAIELLKLGYFMASL